MRVEGQDCMRKAGVGVRADQGKVADLAFCW